MRTNEYKNIGETVYSETLENGLTVYVIPKPSYMKSYAFFAANYGGADRRFQLEDEWIDTPAGVAHFLEHKLFDTPDGGNALPLLSANGASPNAFTSSGMTAYHFECTDGFYENLRVLLDFVSVPYFTAESVEKEQGIIGQEIRMIEDHPGFAVYINLIRSLYAENPVRDAIAGSVESIAQITHQTLYNCHKVFYTPSNMTLCVAGDVDPEKICQIAREILPREPGQAARRDYGEDDNELPVRTFTETAMEVSAPLFVMGSKVTPALKGLDRLRQKMAGDLALRCLMGRASPLYNRLYAQGILNNNFDSEFDFTAGTAMVLVQGESSDPQRVRDEIAAEAVRISKEGLCPQLFNRVKKTVFGEKLRLLDSFDHQCYSFAEGHFSGYCAFDGFALLSEVGLQEAAEFIGAFLRPEKLALSVVTPNK